MTRPDREGWIKESVAYIREKATRDAFAEGRQLLPGQAQTKREELREKLETALRRADATIEALGPLHRELQLGLDQFGEMADRISEAWNCALNVQAECAMALNDTLPPARTREMELHQTAVRLAVAYDPGPGARSLALEVMAAAGLIEPGQATLTRWLKEARQQ